MQHWCRGIDRGSVNVLFFLSNLEETMPDETLPWEAAAAPAGAPGE